MKKSIKKNYIYNTFYQVLQLLTPLITTPYISRVLGADGIGEYSFVISINTYFVLLASFGIAAYGQREVSYCQEDRDRRTVLFWETKSFSLILSVVVLIIYLTYISLFTKESVLLYLILSINILNVFADISWLYQGMEEFGKIVLRNTIFKIINILSIFIFVNQKSDLFVYAFLITFINLLSNLFLWKDLNIFVDKPKFLYCKPFKHFKGMLVLYLPTIAIQIYTVLDKTMLGVITNSAFQNGYYEQSLKISKMVLMLVTSLATVMIPRIGYHFEKMEWDTVKELMYQTYNFAWFLSFPLCFGLIGIADNFVPWFFGPGYENVSILLKISGFIIIAIGISNITGLQYLVPTKREKLLTASVVIGAVVNFCLNLYLIPRYQAFGAMIASVLAETVVTCVQFYFVRKELSVTNIISLIRNYLLSSVIMLFVLRTLSEFLSSSIMNTFILIFSGVLVYFVILFIIKDKFTVATINSFKILIINKIKK